MANMSVYTVCLLLVVLYDLSTCPKIKRSLCLQTAFAFVDDHNNCNFSKEYAENILDEKNPTCQTKCEVKIDKYAEKSNVLWEVDLSFGSAIYRYLSPCTGARNKMKLNMSIDCPNWNSVQTRPSTLPNSVDHQVQTRPSTLPNSVDHQVQTRPSTLLNSVDHQANVGSIFGALFGGLLLGVILATAAVVIIYRRSNRNVKNRKEEPNPTFADNYSSAKVVDHSDLKKSQTKNITQEVSPYPCLREQSVYNHSSEKPINGETQDDVYNHLHEQVKQDDVNYYDHACASSFHNGDMGDYSHLRQAMS